jgi:stage II sporulation protein D
MRLVRFALVPWLALFATDRAAADETSTGDKLRILYSNRFTFTDSGVPLITVEIMSGQQSIHLSAKSGVVARPDGAGGSTISAAGDGTAWTVTATGAKAAVIQDWTVVDTLGPDDTAGVAAAIEKWQKRGLDVKSFEIGTVFGVGGEVIDTREVRIAVDPVAQGKGGERAAALAKKYGITTSVHAELIRRPQGTIVATSGDTTVENPGVVWFEPKSAKETITVADVVAGGGGSQLKTTTEDRRYWGSVYVTFDRGGDLVVVNAVSEDKLLAGLVPAEMFPDAPDAALEAQAIAARTELLQKIGRRNLTDPFLLCSTQQCQVYAGAGKEQPRTTRAVEATRGIVLLRDGGGMVDVRYSASCGGHSEDNDWIWGGDPDPSLRGKLDGPKPKGKSMSRIDDENLDDFLAAEPTKSWCGKSKIGPKNRFRWTVSFGGKELDALIAADYPGVGHVTSMKGMQRGVSGRIQTLAIKGDKGSAEVSGDLRIRRLLGGLRSTLFKIVPTKSGFELHGAGFGHGVGMCQMGAIGMAEAGKDRDEILDHYYPGTHRHRLY